ncbi:MAG: hypothetical protein ABSB59_22420 [Streptosporangiaceae bacterium]
MAITNAKNYWHSVLYASLAIRQVNLGRDLLEVGFEQISRRQRGAVAVRL